MARPGRPGREGTDVIDEKFAVAIMVGSPHSTPEVVERTLTSIRACIPPGSLRLLIYKGTNIRPALRGYLDAELARSRDMLLLGTGDIPWAQFINQAIDTAEGCRYFIKSHDDIELQTPGFDRKIEEFYAGMSRDVGWVSFTDTGYRRGDFSPPVREGYFDDVLHEDAYNRMTVFQFHRFPPNWTRSSWLRHYAYVAGKRVRRRLGIPLKSYPKRRNPQDVFPLDMPHGPVRCHAPFNHFVLIRHDVLRKLGYCEDWGTKNALLVDEDWGLRALTLNIPNVWIPSIEYLHDRGDFGEYTRSWNQISEHGARVDRLFFEKWGFHASPSREELGVIRERYGDTLVVWSMGRKSFEWDYL
jgi:hypothetical protein